MFDSCTITMFLFSLFLLHSSLAFYVKEDRYKKEISEFEEVETITDPVKVKLLMAQPGKEEIKFTPVLIPDKFSKYDSIDHDGHISLNELIKTTGAERNAKSAFQAADEDADGEISREEFKKAPWAMKPTSVNSKDEKDYIDESKFENITVEEEAEAEKVGRNGEGSEEEEEEGNEESVEDLEAGEKYEEGGEESFIEKVRKNKKENQLEEEEEEEEEEVKKDGVRGEREGEEEGGDQEVIIEVNEKEAGEESKVGGVKKEETTEKGGVGGDDKKVEVGEIGTGEIENSEQLRNESIDIDKGKEGGSNEKEEKGDDEEKEKEETDQQKVYITKSKGKENQGNLERPIQLNSNSELLDPLKLGIVPDKTVDQIDVNFIEDDLEGREWLDIRENSGELPESNYNQDSYSDEEPNTSEESYESFTD